MIPQKENVVCHPCSNLCSQEKDGNLYGLASTYTQSVLSFPNFPLPFCLHSTTLAVFHRFHLPSHHFVHAVLSSRNGVFPSSVMLSCNIHHSCNFASICATIKYQFVRHQTKKETSIREESGLFLLTSTHETMDTLHSQEFDSSICSPLV